MISICFLIWPPPGSSPVTSRIQSPAIVNCSGASYVAVAALGHGGGHRRHAGMRHQSFEPQARAGHRLLIAIAKRQANDDWRAGNRWRRIERPRDADRATGFTLAIPMDIATGGRARRGEAAGENERQPSGRGAEPAVPRTRALLLPCRGRRREHVVIHRDHHRDEDDRVVEEVQLDARHPQLQDARRHRPAEQVLAEQVLPLQQEVLDVMKELDRQRDGPPLPIAARR